MLKIDDEIRNQPEHKLLTAAGWYADEKLDKYFSGDLFLKVGYRSDWSDDETIPKIVNMPRPVPVSSAMQIYGNHISIDYESKEWRHVCGYIRAEDNRMIDTFFEEGIGFQSLKDYLVRSWVERRGAKEYMPKWVIEAILSKQS